MPLFQHPKHAYIYQWEFNLSKMQYIYTKLFKTSFITLLNKKVIETYL